MQSSAARNTQQQRSQDVELVRLGEVPHHGLASDVVVIYPNRSDLWLADAKRKQARGQQPSF